jgi:hypothetical protein
MNNTDGVRDRLLRGLNDREAEDVRQYCILAALAATGAAGKLPPERTCHLITTQGVAFLMSRLGISQDDAIDFLARRLTDFLDNYAALHRPAK